MKLNYTFITTLFAFIALLSLNNCSKSIPCDYEVKRDTISFTPQIEAQVPNTGRDTLYFLTAQGDTSILVGNGKKYGYNYEISEDGAPECGPRAYRYNQTYTINYLSINGLGGAFKFIQIADIESSRLRVVAEYIGQYGPTNGVTYFFVPIPPSHGPNDTLFGESPFRSGVKDSCFKCVYNNANGVIKFTNCKTNEEYNLLQ